MNRRTRAGPPGGETARDPAGKALAEWGPCSRRRLGGSGHGDQPMGSRASQTEVPCSHPAHWPQARPAWPSPPRRLAGRRRSLPRRPPRCDPAGDLPALPHPPAQAQPRPGGGDPNHVPNHVPGKSGGWTFTLRLVRRRSAPIRRRPTRRGVRARACGTRDARRRSPREVFAAMCDGRPPADMRNVIVLTPSPQRDSRRERPNDHAHACLQDQGGGLKNNQQPDRNHSPHGVERQATWYPLAVPMWTRPPTTASAETSPTRGSQSVARPVSRLRAATLSLG
jgi:hypothetical protein